MKSVGIGRGHVKDHGGVTKADKEHKQENQGTELNSNNNLCVTGD